MKTVALVGALGLLASAAQAQTSTDCNYIGSTLHCESAPQGPQIDWSLANRTQVDPVGSMSRGYMLGRMIAEDRARRQAQAAQAQAQYEAQQTRASRAQIVAPMIRQGQCNEAIAKAIEWSDLDLAQVVHSVCVQAK